MNAGGPGDSFARFEYIRAASIAQPGLVAVTLCRDVCGGVVVKPGALSLLSGRMRARIGIGWVYTW